MSTPARERTGEERVQEQPVQVPGDDRRDGPRALVLAVLLTALVAAGGAAVSSTPATIVQTAAVLIGIGIVLFARSRPVRAGALGQWSVALFAVFVGLSGLSITWSVDPGATWDEVNRLLAYLAVFTASVVAARTFPARWRAVLLGLAISAVAVSAIALLSKIAPGTFAPDDEYARLREPLQYWNAVGLAAAFGVPIWLYYAARRVGRPILDVLSAPALMILLVTVTLAYSRGSIVAAVVGAAVWLVFAPARLRTLAAVVPPLAGAAIVVLWAFGQPELTMNDVPLSLRETAGGRLGVVLGVVLVLVTVGSLVVQFLNAATETAERTRRRIGTALLVGLAILPIGGLVAMSQSSQGLGGTISSGWAALTDPQVNSQAGSAPGNDPARLGQVGNARSLYWRDAARVFEERPVFGAGANGYRTARLQIRDDASDVAHAHGFLPQVLADLGVVGLGVALLLLGAWAIAAGRTLGPRGGPWPAERLGAIAMVAAVVTYGVHSSIDWTWSFPTATIPALIAAGWLAGRGSITSPAPAPPPGPADARSGLVARLGRAVPVVQLVAFAALATWSLWQPWRSFHATQDAYAALADGQTELAAQRSARAVELSRVSIEAATARAAVLANGGDVAAGRSALEAVIAKQPQNPEAWRQLMVFELGPGSDPARAVAAYRAARFLDPRSGELAQLRAEALGQAQGQTAPPAQPTP